MAGAVKQVKPRSGARLLAAALLAALALRLPGGRPATAGVSLRALQEKVHDAKVGAQEQAAALVAPLRRLPRALKLQDWQLGGELGNDGWKGKATYMIKDGHTVRFGASGSEMDVKEVDATFGYKTHGPEPDVNLVLAHRPGTKAVGYIARLSKRLKIAEGPQPELAAVFTNNGVMLDAGMSMPVADGADMGMRLQVPYSYSKKKANPTISADASYKVGGGVLVGTLTTAASGGASFSAAYKMN